MEEEEFEQKPNGWWRALRGVVALAVLVGLVYISGVYQYFFFSRTSPDIQQEPVQVAIDAEVLAVPLTVFVVQSNGAHGSERTEENVRNLVEQADRVWEQASIDLRIDAIHTVQKTGEEIEALYRNAGVFAQTLEGFDRATINAVLVGDLQGLNGVAFGGIPLIAVADYTTVFDFRAFAHEVGHKLGLSHVVNEKRLMHQGANGFELSLEEIMQAREFVSLREIYRR
jgi:hypothetical protein